MTDATSAFPEYGYYNCLWFVTTGGHILSADYAYSNGECTRKAPPFPYVHAGCSCGEWEHRPAAVERPDGA